MSRTTFYNKTHNVYAAGDTVWNFNAVWIEIEGGLPGLIMPVIERVTSGTGNALFMGSNF